MEEIVEKKKAGRPKNAVPADNIQALLETVLEQNRILMESMSDRQSKQTLELAAELRKPTDMEQKKLDEERESRRKRALMAVEAARQQESQQGAKQSRCPHADKNGVTTFVSQVYGDGYWKPFCSRCQLVLPKIKATHEEEMGGINLRTWENVTADGLRQLARQREPQLVGA